MYVEQIMNRAVWSCSPDASLIEVIGKMVQADAGWIPVVEEDTGMVVGVVTDRDVAVKAWETGLSLGSLLAADAMTRDVAAVGERDQVTVAEEVMRTRHVRRLPVLSVEGHLVGMIALDDLAQLAARRGNADVTGLTAEAIARVLAGIAESRRPGELAPLPEA